MGVVERHREVWLESINDPRGFWTKVATEIEWFKKWETALDENNPPFYRWFVGGKLNITYNCLDRHIRSGRGNKPALIWVGSDGQVLTLTYSDLLRKVSQLSEALRKIGVRKGDRITVYMPMVPEAMIVILSVARIGAVHNVVFSGFGIQALAERIRDSDSRVVMTADAMLRRGSMLHLKERVDEAVDRAGCVERVIVYSRLGTEVKMREGRDYWYHELLEEVQPTTTTEPEHASSEDPLFILYTSGTTGRPKGVLHLHGPYTVWAYAHNKWLFNWQDEDVFFSTPDIGWINGHSYSTYGPLLNGATVLWYEDAADYPHPGIWWEIVDKFRVTSMWVAPTAVRLLMKYGDQVPRRYSLESLKILVSAGEILGSEAWRWLSENVARDREDCYVIETWGQTENSGFIAAPGGFGIAGGIAYRQGSVGMPYPGINIKILDDQGRTLSPGERGNIVILPPTPPAFMGTVWSEPKRYIESYWSRFKGVYSTGDYGYSDNDGYVYVLGRTDDVIKIAGHRLAPADVENIVALHPAVAEAAVVSVPDPVKGEVLAVFASPKVEAITNKGKLIEELRELIKRELGGIAVIGHIALVDKLPRTRTGKIMRRMLRAILLSQEIGDVSTLEEEASVEEVRMAVERLREELTGH
ncbi:MAG: acetate--CoA ligase [Candidatus Caldarchaeum sp.]